MRRHPGMQTPVAPLRSKTVSHYKRVSHSRCACLTARRRCICSRSLVEPSFSFAQTAVRSLPAGSSPRLCTAAAVPARAASRRRHPGRLAGRRRSALPHGRGQRRRPHPGGVAYGGSAAGLPPPAGECCPVSGAGAAAGGAGGALAASWRNHSGAIDVAGRRRQAAARSAARGDGDAAGRMAASGRAAAVPAAAWCFNRLAGGCKGLGAARSLPGSTRGRHRAAGANSESPFNGRNSHLSALASQHGALPCNAGSVYVAALLQPWHRSLAPFTWMSIVTKIHILFQIQVLLLCRHTGVAGQAGGTSQHCAQPSRRSGYGAAAPPGGRSPHSTRRRRSCRPRGGAHPSDGRSSSPAQRPFRWCFCDCKPS